MSSRYLLTLVSCLLLSISLQPAFGAEQKRLSIVDYFLLLPKDTFEAPPASMLEFIRQPTAGLIDKGNGYMSCIGDGAQPEFEVALFRYKDDRPLLVVCSGELEGPDGLYLEFFELGKNGSMQKAPRAIFPVKNEVCSFKLPRTGRTILVSDKKGRKLRQKFTWNGESFQEVK